MTHKITRRTLILSSLGLVAGGSLLYGSGRSIFLNNSALSTPLLIPPSCVHTDIGKAYLEGTRPKPTAKSLEYALKSRLPSLASCPNKNLSLLLNMEYANNKTTEIKGWILPETIVLINTYNALQGEG